MIVLGSATAGLPASMGSPRLCARQARTSRATSTVAGSRTPEPPAPYRPPPARHDNKKTAVLQTGVLHPSRHLSHLINSSLCCPPTPKTKGPKDHRWPALISRFDGHDRRRYDPRGNDGRSDNYAGRLQSPTVPCDKRWGRHPVKIR